MSKGRQIVMVIAGLGLVGLAGEEHLARQTAERRYREALESRRALELEFGEVRATHQRLANDFKQE